MTKFFMPSRMPEEAEKLYQNCLDKNWYKTLRHPTARIFRLSFLKQLSRPQTPREAKRGPPICVAEVGKNIINWHSNEKPGNVLAIVDAKSVILIFTENYQTHPKMVGPGEVVGTTEFFEDYPAV